MLCMDTEAYRELAELSLAEVHPLTLDEFERGDEALRQTKQSRSLLEYYFTCTPSLPLYILSHYLEVDRITYLDADLFFYADPAAVFTEIGDHSIAIVGHRFSRRLQHLEALGIYNVGWLSFLRDSHAQECLLWWRERCIEWCYDQLENERFADQKYLDDWPTRFERTVVLRHRGANLAPWNLADYQVSWREDQLWVDDQPLIFFHFHSLKRVHKWLFDSNLAHYETTLSPLVRRKIYTPYLQTLLEVEHDMKALKRWKRDPSLLRHPPDGRSQGIQSLWSPVRNVLQDTRHFVKGLLAHQYLFVPSRRAKKEQCKREDHSPKELMGRP
jgi:hypothetical protein